MDVQNQYIIAALIAAIVGLLGLRNSIAIAKMQASFQIFVEKYKGQSADDLQRLQFDHDEKMQNYNSLAPEAEAVRRTMRELSELAVRVGTSVRRLLLMIEKLDDEKMMLETMHTMVIVSDFFSKADEHAIVVFPEDVASIVSNVKRYLTKVLLELDYSVDIRKLPGTATRLEHPAKALEREIITLQTIVRDYVAPRLEKSVSISKVVIQSAHKKSGVAKNSPPK